MNNPFQYIPDDACREALLRLTSRIEAAVGSVKPEDTLLRRELEAGKMLGVLIASDSAGLRHTLYAFSGQLGPCEFVFPGFVEPVFNYLSPDGHFKAETQKIARMSSGISQFESNTVAPARNRYQKELDICNGDLNRFKQQCRRSKFERDARRKAGVSDPDILAALIRQSQFEKAELRRMKKRHADYLRPFATEMQAAENRLSEMKQSRRSASEALQQWLFSNFKLLNARGESKSLSEIFAAAPEGVPPSGAGECCAPKLLQAAYRRGWKPVSIAEFWYGKPKNGEVRIHGQHYPACRGKCLPILSWMLQGLEVSPPLGNEYMETDCSEPEIIFENQWFCVVSKPSGMLSVPGKCAADSVQSWLERKYGAEKQVKVAHRLDRDTSGLLIATFGLRSYRVMQLLFATRKVRKRYVAELEGDYRALGLPRQGEINLPLILDPHDRPRQRVCRRYGKEAVTDYEFISANGNRSRVIFHPHTGRTHQLRVHAASAEGLGMPIVGDPLYGKNRGPHTPGLLLHAERVEFFFPIDGQEYSFETEAPF